MMVPRDSIGLSLAGREFELDWTTERLALSRAAMATTFGELVRPFSDGPASDPSLPVVDQLLEIILGTGKYRFSPRPSAPGRDLLRDRIEHAVSREAPVSFLTMWGAVKHYVVDEDQGVDLAEVFASVRLLELVQSIERVYRPGAVVRIVVEDFGVWYEDAYGRDSKRQESVVRNSNFYVHELRTLIDVVAAGAVVPVLFFDAVEDDYRTCIARVERNKQLLTDYWSADEDDEAFGELSSAGWQGRLHLRTRNHYLTRLQNLYPAESDEQHVERVLQYLAMVLLYEQLKMLTAIDDNAIRLAFYPPAPLLAEDRVRSRIHLRGLPSTLCSLTMPPWTSKGCWVLGPDGSMRPRIESFMELYTSRATVDEGELVLSTDQGVARARMDIVQRNGGGVDGAGDDSAGSNGSGRRLHITNR